MPTCTIVINEVRTIVLRNFHASPDYPQAPVVTGTQTDDLQGSWQGAKLPS